MFCFQVQQLQLMGLLLAREITEPFRKIKKNKIWDKMSCINGQMVKSNLVISLVPYILVRIGKYFFGLNHVLWLVHYIFRLLVFWSIWPKSAVIFIYFYKNAQYSTFPQRSSKMRLWKSINMTAIFWSNQPKNQKTKMCNEPDNWIALHWNINSIKGCSIRVGNIARPHLVWPNI